MITAYIFILGLIIGSFLNALIWRMHTRESMMTRSACPICRRQLAWFENIPVFSYLFLRGKCRHCHKRISIQYPLVELVTGVLFVLAYNAMPTTFLNFMPSDLLKLMRLFFVISVMITVFIYDLRWYLILDRVTATAAIVLIFFNLALLYLNGQSVMDISWSHAVYAFAVSAGFFAAQYYGSRGKWIGFGDVKLGVVMALALGWPNALVAIAVAYILGAFIGVGLILSGNKRMGSELPFGTFLAIATVIGLLWGGQVSGWYFKLIGM